MWEREIWSPGLPPTSLDSKLSNIVAGLFTPVLGKHTKQLSLVDVLSIGTDRIQRNFEPMKKQVEAWKSTRIRAEMLRGIVE